MINNRIYALFKKAFFSDTVRSTAYMYLSRVAAMGLGFIGNVLIIRALGPENYGLYATAIAFITLISGITDLGLTTSAIKFGSLYSKTDPKKVDLLFKIVGHQKLIISGCVGVVGFFLSDAIAVRIYNKPELVFPLKVSMIYISMDILALYAHSMLEARQKYFKSSLITFVMSVAKVLAVVTLFYFFNALTLKNLLYLQIGLGLFLIFVCSAFVDMSFIRTEGDANQKKQIKKDAWHFSKWVMVSTLFFPIAKRLDIVMLNYYVDSAMVGIYACAFQLVVPLKTLKAALHNVLLPKISKINTYNGYINYSKNYTVMTFMFSTFFIPVIVFARPIIYQFFGEKYAPSVFIFQLLLISLLFVLIFNPLHLIAYSAGHPWVIAFKDALSLIINIAINLFLIPKLGITGAAWGALITTIIGSLLPLVYIYFKILLPMRLNQTPLIQKTL